MTTVTDPPAHRCLLVDAANVVGSRPDGWWRDRAGAAARLVADVRAAARSGRLAARVVVVLEGAARPGAAEGEADGVAVIHAAAGGDEQLVALAACLEGPLLVSADRALCRRVADFGVRSVGPSWLRQRIEGAGAPPAR